MKTRKIRVAWKIFLSISGIFISVLDILGQRSEGLNEYVFPDFVCMDTALCSTHSFVNFMKNNYCFYTPESTNFDFLYRQYDSMLRFGDRKLNFYHIGGSHVQADIYTNDIRMFLQTQLGNLPGDRGWVFPYSLAGTNNPGSYRFASEGNFVGVRASLRHNLPIELGLLGMALVSEDSVVQMSFHYRQTVSKPPFSKVRVFHNRGYFPYEINFGADELLVSSWFRNEEIGFTEFVFSDELDSFNIEFVRDIGQMQPLELYGFQLLNDRPGVSYHAVGVNGAGLYSYLDCRYFEQQLTTLAPDLFVFAVGTNDANVPYDKFNPQIYQRNLEEIIKIVLRVNPKCALLLTVPNDAYYKRRSLNLNIARQREVIIELATKYNMAVLDFYGVMGELGSSKTWQINELMREDLVHFTPLGYHLKGELFIDAFLKYLIQFSERLGR